MLNALLDFGSEDGLSAQVGGGLGAGRVHSRVATLGSNDLADSDSGFAWQALAGVRLPVSRNVDLGLKYRCLSVNSLDFEDVFGNKISTRWRSHSVLAGITYNFGAPPPPPPPPPPPARFVAPPPPPPPPSPVCNKDPFVEFFDWNSAEIGPAAATVLDSATSAYASCRNIPVMLAGYADRSGSATYNVDLSERRADSARAYMVGKGIPAGTITTQAFGESNPRVPTADGVREPQNRRVEISFGPGSGN